MDGTLGDRMGQWFENALGEGVGGLCHGVMLLGIFVLGVPLMAVGAALDEAFLPGGWR